MFLMIPLEGKLDISSGYKFQNTLIPYWSESLPVNLFLPRQRKDDS